MFLLCKAAEVTQTHSISERLKPEDSQIGNNSNIGETSQYRFYRKNDISGSEHVQSHTSTRWSPWTPIPGSHNIKYNSSHQNGNVTNSSMDTDANVISDRINGTRNTTKSEEPLSNGTFNGTYFNTTHQSTFLNYDNGSHTVAPSPEATSSVSKTHTTKTRKTYSKSMTYYFWDTIFLILKCFKHHWRTGLVDCVTARTSTLLEDLLGIGGTRREQLQLQLQLQNSDSNELMPYDEVLEETPRHDEEGLQLADDDEGDEEDEEDEDVYDEGTRDSSEGESCNNNIKIRD
jgi:hypothetical protein